VSAQKQENQARQVLLSPPNPISKTEKENESKIRTVEKQGVETVAHVFLWQPGSIFSLAANRGPIGWLPLQEGSI
jgi:hypothetical protein